MNRRIISGMIISALILFVIFTGCTSSIAGGNSGTPVGSKATESSRPGEVARTPSPTIQPLENSQEKLPSGTRDHTFAYVLNGVKGTVTVPLSDSVYADYTKKPDPAYRSPYNAASNSSYYLAFTTDPKQLPAIASLAQAIREKTPDADDQARIAVSLVQHIPYKEGGKQYRFPYEVLYKNQGVCGEKSMLLALLLKELGFGSSVFYFLPEDHMTVGIKADPPYDFRNSGYAFIEATEPYIITDSTTDDLAQWKFTSTMETTPVGNGKGLGSIGKDYNDAREWAGLEAKIKHLSASEYAAWQALNTKYDLSYYT